MGGYCPAPHVSCLVVPQVAWAAGRQVREGLSVQPGWGWGWAAGQAGSEASANGRQREGSCGQGWERSGNQATNSKARLLPARR